MNKNLIQSAKPTDQSQYQMGFMDGTRYHADGHTELLSRYQSGSADYRMGWNASVESPRSIDPDFAS